MTTRFKNHSVLAVFSLTLFTSAALMFSFQPMIGKMLLPIVGGSPSGWMVAMAFFQTVLLAGYLGAHLLSRLTPRLHGFAYLGLVCLGSLFLPVTLAKSAHLVMGDLPGPAEVFLLLTITVAVPFLALSATSSTLQRLFMATDHPASDNPYFLYAASNLGSFVGLFLYPFVVEPNLRLSSQSAFWLFGYLFLILFICLCLYQARKGKEAKAVVEKGTPVGWRQRAQWMLLAFMPSALMMALTFYATTEFISMPLLWVIPLGLYLLTFIVAFSSRSIVSLDWLVRAQPVAVTLAIVTIFVGTPPKVGTFEIFALHAMLFTVVAQMCHLKLAQSRPADGARNLTLFYLLLAVGGAAGGVFNAFVAPFVFNGAIEYPLLLVLSCLLNPTLRLNRWDWLLAALIGLLVVVKLENHAAFVAIAGLIATAAFPISSVTLVAMRPRIAFIGCGLIAMAILSHPVSNVVYEGRNFYGVLRVYDVGVKTAAGTEKVRFLSNGTTLHGKQSLSPDKERTPTSYYTKDGPLGDMFAALKPKDIAAVGLGAGTIACYGTPDNTITFFEINPQDTLVAEKYFTYLSKCGSGKQPEVIPGDGRLSLQRMKDKKFDLIVLDAFSGDAVPTHLMTLEAISLYLDHLTDNGVLLFHISNRHFSLGTPLTANADALNLANRFIVYDPPNNPYSDQSFWLAMARKEDNFPKDLKLPWAEHSPAKGVIPWTDDYSDLLSIMHL